MERPRIAAIVPAFNEEATVGQVIRTIVAAGFFDEVILVSDGSTDATAERARQAGATLVHELPRNSGKGAALAHGVMHTDAPFVCFFDADLLGLTAENIGLLLRPVLDGARYMNVGLRDRGPFWTGLAKRLPLVGGERALRREIFDLIPKRYLNGFKVETALNYFCRVNGLPYGFTVMPGLKIRRKMQKVGAWKGFREYLGMWAQVIWAMIQVRLAQGQFLEHAGHMGHRHR